jgi:hypothetical protein
MTALSAFLAGLLAAWPGPVAEGAEGDRPVAAAPMPVAARHDPLAIWAELARRFRDDDAAQVRIEQHIIWRVSPVRGPARQNMLALSPQGAPPPKLVERKMGECVPMASIAGGRPESGSRLLLFLRDRRMVAANLEKACSARDFYSGFYVDKPNADGKLCVDRDRILARNGARCEISSFRQLVADE